MRSLVVQGIRMGGKRKKKKEKKEGRRARCKRMAAATFVVETHAVRG